MFAMWRFSLEKKQIPFRLSRNSRIPAPHWKDYSRLIYNPCSMKEESIPVFLKKGFYYQIFCTLKSARHDILKWKVMKASYKIFSFALLNRLIFHTLFEMNQFLISTASNFTGTSCLREIDIEQNTHCCLFTQNQK